MSKRDKSNTDRETKNKRKKNEVSTSTVGEKVENEKDAKEKEMEIQMEDEHEEPKTSRTATEKPVKQWTVDEVVQWAKNFLKPAHVSKLEDQEVNGIALLHLDTITLEKCGFPVGPTLHLLNEIEDLKGVPKRPRLEKSEEIVVSYFNDGYHASNFNTFREETVTNLLKLNQSHPSILFHAPPFCGKSTLIRLIEEHLKKCGYTVLVVDFLKYFPWDTSLDDFWKKNTGLNLDDTSHLPLAKKTYILIDEFQKTYPQTIDEVQACYQFEGIFNENCNPSKIAFFHQEFKAHFKSLKQSGIYLLCFSSYDSTKIGSGCPTPYTFELKLDYNNFGKFLHSELEELYIDFVKRSRIGFVKHEGFPESLKLAIQNQTGGHVGFTSCILHQLNLHSTSIHDESSTLVFLQSKELYDVLATQRPTPKFDELSEPQKLAVREVWLKGKTEVANADYLVRQGWFIRDGATKLSLVCPLSKQLILMAMHSTINQPERDNFQSLPHFMDHFIDSLTSSFLNKTLHLSVDEGAVKEALWQNEFYHFGRVNLSNQYVIGVEVQKGPFITPSGTEEEFKLGGKIDFYINKTRKWAIEFLIKGDQTKRVDLKKDSNLRHHAHRLEPTGKYKDLPRNEQLVVDFRPLYGSDLTDVLSKRNGGPKKKFLPNVWVVVYDNKEWSFIEVLPYGSDGFLDERYFKKRSL